MQLHFDFQTPVASHLSNGANVTVLFQLITWCHSCYKSVNWPRKWISDATCAQNKRYIRVMRYITISLNGSRESVVSIRATWFNSRKGQEIFSVSKCPDRLRDTPSPISVDNGVAFHRGSIGLGLKITTHLYPHVSTDECIGTPLTFQSEYIITLLWTPSEQ